MTNPQVSLDLSGDGSLSFTATVNPTTEAFWTHEANHGCELPAHKGITPAHPFPDSPGVRGPSGLLGYLPWPLNQPSTRQNRTTQRPGNTGSRHPRNRVKTMPANLWGLYSETIPINLTSDGQLSFTVSQQ